MCCYSYFGIGQGIPQRLIFCMTLTVSLPGAATAMLEFYQCTNNLLLIRNNSNNFTKRFLHKPIIHLDVWILLSTAILADNYIILLIILLKKPFSHIILMSFQFCLESMYF